MAINPGGTFPPIAGGVPGSAAPPGMAQAGDPSAMAGGAGQIDPMALLAMAKLARTGAKGRRRMANRTKSKSRRK